MKRWDEAIQLTPDNAVLYEMKSQVKKKLYLVHTHCKIDFSVNGKSAIVEFTIRRDTQLLC